MLYIVHVHVCEPRKDMDSCVCMCVCVGGGGGQDQCLLMYSVHGVTVTQDCPVSPCPRKLLPPLKCAYIIGTCRTACDIKYPFSYGFSALQILISSDCSESLEDQYPMCPVPVPLVYTQAWKPLDNALLM